MNEVRKIQHRPSWEPTLLLRVFLDGRQRHTKEFLWSILSSFKTVLLLSQKPWKEEGKLQFDIISNTCVLLRLHCKIKYLIDLHIYDQVHFFFVFKCLGYIFEDSFREGSSLIQAKIPTVFCSHLCFFDIKDRLQDDEACSTLKRVGSLLMMGRH